MFIHACAVRSVMVLSVLSRAGEKKVKEVHENTFHYHAIKDTYKWEFSRTLDSVRSAIKNFHHVHHHTWRARAEYSLMNLRNRKSFPHDSSRLLDVSEGHSTRQLDLNIPNNEIDSLQTQLRSQSD